MSSGDLSDYKKRDKEVGTGSALTTPDYIKLTIPFGKYEIVVKLTRDLKFIGIEEVRINSDFRSFEQGSSGKGQSYIDEYHPE